MKLIVLTQDGCAPCAIVKNQLVELEAEYTEINVAQDPEAIDKYDIHSTPVVILEDKDGVVAKTIGDDLSVLKAMVRLRERSKED